MTMFNDIEWTKNGSCKECFRTLKMIGITQRDFRWNIGLFFVQEKWYGANDYMKVERNRRREGAQFRKQRTSSFPSNKCVGTRIPEKERWEVFDSSNAELSFRMINSAKQLIIYGAVAGLV